MKPPTTQVQVLGEANFPDLFIMTNLVALRLGVSTNYLMHGFIWNYPNRFAGICQKAPLKSLGSHPVDVFASLEAGWPLAS